MAKAKIWGISPDGLEEEKKVVAIMCPGCKTYHTLNTREYVGGIPVWNFNNNFEAPTFTPSLLVRTGKYVDPNFDDEGLNLSSMCHSFITDGKIQFLDDCTHELKNQIVELPEIDS